MPFVMQQNEDGSSRLRDLLETPDRFEEDGVEYERAKLTRTTTGGSEEILWYIRRRPTLDEVGLVASAWRGDLGGGYTATDLQGNTLGSIHTIA